MHASHSISAIRSRYDSAGPDPGAMGRRHLVMKRSCPSSWPSWPSCLRG